MGEYIEKGVRIKKNRTKKESRFPDSCFLLFTYDGIV